MRTRAVLLSLVLAAAGLLVASPASADHIAEVRTTGCYAGQFTGGFPGDVTTSKVVIRYEGDVVRTTCTFTGLPREQYNEDIGYLWTRVTRVTTQEVTGCGFELADGRYVTGPGTVTFTPGGTAKVRCTFKQSEAWPVG